MNKDMTMNHYILKLENKLAEQESIISQFQKDAKASIKVFAEQKKTIERLNSDIKILTDGHDRLQGANSQLNQQAKANQKQIKELQKEIKSLEKEVAQAQNSNLKISQEKSNLTKELTSANKTIKDLSKQNTSLIEKYTQLENTCQNYDKSLRIKVKEVLSWQEKNEILENKIEELQNHECPTIENPHLTCLICQELTQEKEEILTQAEQARNEQAETIDKLEQENNQLDTDLNKAVDLLESKDKTISQLQAKTQELNKTIKELKNQAINPSQSQENQNTLFHCDICQLTKQGTYIKRKIDSPFEPRTHNKLCYVCSSCQKYTKELNETNFDPENNPYKYDQ